jgi:hypothetical protein
MASSGLLHLPMLTRPASLTAGGSGIFNPAGGAGLRIKFNKKTDTNIGIDYGRSKDYSSISINLGETF